MTTGHLLAIAWSPDASVLGGSAALLVAYAAWLRGRVGSRAVPFIIGVIVMVVALVSPIDRLGELYLFSVHMLQHMLLILVVPPLLLWGLPPAATRRLLRVPALGRLERVIGRPAVTLPVKILTLWLWHLPVLYGAALRNENIHALEHLLFLATAVMFWWPLLNPLRERRLSPPAAMLYLFGAMTGLFVLGMAITFAPTPLYAFYLNPPDPYGALSLIRNGWHLSVLADQQIGGLFMWIVGGVFYIIVILAQFGRWFGEPETDLPGPSGLEAGPASGGSRAGAVPVGAAGTAAEPSAASGGSPHAIVAAPLTGRSGLATPDGATVPVALIDTLEGAQ